MGKTAIPWVAREGTVPRTWNVTRGCTAVSEGCERCYARAYHRRFAAHRGQNEWNEPVVLPETLTEPYSWRKPSTVFVCSMSDLFHEAIPDYFIFDALGIALRCGHTFIFLTKRPARMLDLTRVWARGIYGDPEVSAHPFLPFWMGVTVENQEQADLRIPYLAQIATEVRFVSCEPLLGPLNLRPWLPALDWVIVGCESGPGARHMDEDWVRDIRNDCQLPFFYKQAFINGKKVVNPPLDGRTWTEWPRQKSSKGSDDG